MSTTGTDRLIDSYLRQMRGAARGLPRRRRDELMEEVEGHLREVVPPGSSEADVRNALERLGDPHTIVAEEFELLGIERATMGKREWGAIFLLPFGSFLLPLIGWLVGVALLWSSRVWTTREKVIGTVIVPGGLSAIIYLALLASGTSCTTGGPGSGGRSVQHCTSPALPAAVGIPLLVVFVMAGLAMPIFLARQALSARA